MPRSPGPVRPRRKDERAYHAGLRQRVVDPIFASIRRRLAAAQMLTVAGIAAEELEAIDRAAAGANFVPDDLIEAVVQDMDSYHRRRTIRAWRSALGVDIAPYLTRADVDPWIRQTIHQNVDLIKTIPRALHGDVRATIEKMIKDGNVVSQYELRQQLIRFYDRADYRIRRLARDQTNKMVGRLTEIRQRQLGVQSYKWLTSQDERVRETHVANSNQIFRWDNPPPETGNPGFDIQCRCVAIAVVESIPGFQAPARRQPGARARRS